MTKIKTQLGSLEIPPRGKCRWLQEALGVSDPEMQLALNIHSYTTLRRWRNDETDQEVSELKRFDLLLELARLAKEAMSAAELRVWMRTPQQRLGATVPCKVLGDLASLNRILQALRDLPRRRQ